MSSNTAKHTHGRQMHLLLKTTGLNVENWCLAFSPVASPLLPSVRRFVDGISGTAEIPQGDTQRASGCFVSPDSWVFYLL